MVDIYALANTMLEQAILYLPKLVTAILTLVIGLWIIKIIGKIADKGMTKKKIDPSLRHFLDSLVTISLKVLLFITVISMFGVQMTSFIAVLGGAALAVGLALQGSLGNFAGGVLILLFKPFKVGHMIEAQGHFGKVAKIQIFNTILTTPENKTIIIPNGPLSNTDIVNYSTEPKLRVNVDLGIGYDDDIDKARTIIEAVIKTNKKILKDPKPAVILKELGDSSVNFQARVWVKGEDYPGMPFFINEEVKKAFDKNKISIPFPQRDVHLYKH